MVTIWFSTTEFGETSETREKLLKRIALEHRVRMREEIKFLGVIRTIPLRKQVPSKWPKVNRRLTMIRRPHNW